MLCILTINGKTYNNAFSFGPALIEGSIYCINCVAKLDKAPVNGYKVQEIEAINPKKQDNYVRITTCLCDNCVASFARFGCD